MILFSVFTFCLSLIFTLAMIQIAKRFRIVDKPASDAPRKLHQKEIPLLGGVAIFLSFFIIFWGARFVYPAVFTHLTLAQLIGFFFGAIFLMLGGFLDDKYNLRPRYQIIFPLLATLAVIIGGTNLKEITNPFGGTFFLGGVAIGDHLLLVDILIFVWLMSMMYTTKLLDGLDGLVAGITVIGSLMITFLSLTPKFYQIDIALLSALFAAANVGFLIFNFYPAKIFLGEGGSLLSGFVLGFLSIAAGGKIATALLVVGLAAVDVLMIIIRRLSKGSSIVSGDAEHLHHRLLHLGFSQRQIVIFFYILAALFGSCTLFLQSRDKFIAIIALFLLAAGIGVIIDKKKLHE